MNILWVSPSCRNTDAAARGRARAGPVDRLDRRAPPGDLAVPGGAGASGKTRGRLAPRLAGLHLQEFGRPSGSGATARIAASYARLGRAANRLLRAGGFDLLHVEVSGDRSRHRSRLYRCPRSRSPSTNSPDRRSIGCSLARRAGPRLGAWLYWRAIGRLQARICRKFDRILTMSEHDRRTLLAGDPALSVGVLPLPCGLDLTRAARVARAPAELLFVGAMHPRRQRGRGAVVPRRDPAAGARRGREVRFTIAGAGPPAEIQRLAAPPGPTSPASSNRSSRSTRARRCSWRRCGLPAASPARRIDALAAGCPS